MDNGPDDFIPTRHSLLSRLKDWDDQESWREFFNTYWKLIYSAAIKAGLTHAEAARALGCSETTISWRLFAARGKLKRILKHLQNTGGAA